MELTENKKPKKNIALFLLALCLFFSALATVISCVFNGNIANEQYYRDSVISGDYIPRVREAAISNLDHIYISYELDDGILDNAFTDEELYHYTQLYMDNLFAKIHDPDMEFDNVFYPAENFKPSIRAYYDEKGYEYTESAVNSLAKDCARSLIPIINPMKQQSIIDPLRVLFTSKFSEIFSNNKTMYLLFAADVLLFALCMAVGKTPIRKKFYFASCSLFCASMLLAVPMTVIKLFDLPSKLSLSQSAFKVFFEKLLYAITDAVFPTLLTLAIIASVIMVLAIILSSTLAFNKNKHE